MKIQHSLLILFISTTLFACNGSDCPVFSDEIEAHAAVIKQINTPDSPNEVDETVDFSTAVIATDFMIEIERIDRTESLSFIKNIRFGLFNNAYACTKPIYGHEQLKSIEIISDADFSDEYPAGSNLKDLFLVAYYHAPYSNELPNVSHSDLSFDQLIEKEVKVMDHMQARLTIKPSKSVKHNLTITVNDDSFFLETVTFK